jgi:RNA polymerase sigma factor (sigma-70 family)
VSTLHGGDLELARRCAAGDEQAWERLILEYRPLLYRSADALDPSGGARDLADALYADLYGMKESDGERRSLFRYFQGRSSLATWLRAVLAQRYVDRLRAQRRFEPLPDEEQAPRRATEAGGRLQAREAPPDPHRPRYLALMQRALAAAVSRLDARDRLRLGCYYVQELTLAETGRLLEEHEATVSRQLARTRRAIRVDVERQLREDGGLTDAELAQCFETASADTGPLDLKKMLEVVPEPGGSETTVARKESARDRSL